MGLEALPLAWSQVKSKRGRKKGVKSDGHACPNTVCAYYGIRNQQIHALSGTHSFGRGARHIRYTQCKPISGGARVGHGEGTMRCWLTRSGEHSRRLHDECLRDLRLGHVQLDELMVQIKGRGRDVWLWVAMDATTKLLCVLLLGPHKQDVAYAVVHTLAAMLAPGCTPAFTSDGLNAYFCALTAHFGHWREPPDGGKPQWAISPDLVYAQLKKIRSWRRLIGTEQRMMSLVFARAPR